MTGPSAELIAVELQRSNSRNSGMTSLDSDTYASECSSRISARSQRSWAGFR